jgi:type II secretory ATPase GspE/PulE/Tfp pilus assembly ATPase PilB-like protein
MMKLFEDLSSFDIDPELVRQLPEDLCRAHHLVLLGKIPDSRHATVPVGMLHPDDETTLAKLRHMLYWTLRPIQLNAYEIDQVLQKTYGETEHLPAADLKLRLSDQHAISFEHEQSIPGMVRDLLSLAVQRNASDVHIERFHQDIDVRLRIDGVLHHLATPIDPSNVQRVVAYFKVLSNLDLTERRRSLDGKVNATYTTADIGAPRQIDLRLNIIPGPDGEELVIRLHDEARINYQLSELGMSPQAYADVERLIHATDGIVLVAGPTASGKTNTLYAMLRAINTDQNKILTVEDPIEFDLSRVNQKQVSPQMSFADYARAFLRQNPDILMIGEIRDESTATIALRAAQTGHLVLTTVHSNDAPSAINRLSTLGQDAAAVADCLRAVISQRLVRRLCKSCNGQSASCSDCHGTGYNGQVGVFEVLEVDQELRALIDPRRGLDPHNVPAFTRLYDDALEKVEAGITSLEEIARKIPQA